MAPAALSLPARGVIRGGRAYQTTRPLPPFLHTHIFPPLSPRPLCPRCLPYLKTSRVFRSAERACGTRNTCVRYASFVEEDEADVPETRAAVVVVSKDMPHTRTREAGIKCLPLRREILCRWSNKASEKYFLRLLLLLFFLFLPHARFRQICSDIIFLPFPICSTSPR